MESGLLSGGARAPRIRVQLDVRGFAGSADQITALLGLEPTFSRIAGEILPLPGTVLVHEENHWILEAPHESGQSLQDQINALLRTIRASADCFDRLPPDARVQLYCGVQDYGRSVALTFSVDILRQLSRIGADLNVDYIDLTDE